MIEIDTHRVRERGGVSCWPLVAAFACLSACGSRSGTGLGAAPVASTSAVASAGPLAPSANPAGTSTHVPSYTEPTYRGLFSRDGRYVVLDALIDLDDTNRKVPLACDLASVQWMDSARVWCVNPDRTQLTALDAATGEARSFPFSGSNELWLDPSEKFLGWGSDGETMLVNTETGASQRLPGSADYWAFHGSTVRVELRGSFVGGRIQLWDASEGREIGYSYVTSGFLTKSFSDDQRWGYDFNTREGQFVVDLKTGMRTVVGAPRETSFALVSFGIVEPFSHDSTRVAAAAMPDGVRVVELATGKVEATLVAPGCEKPMNVRWNKSGDMLVVGDRSGQVCAFDPRTGKLVWSMSMPAAAGPPLPGEDPTRRHTAVSELDFTVDDKGIVAGTVSGVADCEAVLLRASNGEIVRKLGTSMQVFGDGKGGLYAGSFLVGANLKTTPLSMNWTPASTAGDYFADLPAVRCMNADFVGPGCERWKGVTIFDRDARSRWVVGRADDYLGVWSAAKGELVYSMHLPANVDRTHP